MVDEVVVEAEPKAKKPILLIVGGVVALLLVLVGAVVGTLFATGFFKPKPVLTAEQMLEGGGAVDNAGDAVHKDKDGKGGPPAKQTKKSPELTRFDYTYMQLDREFLVNLLGSRKVMSVQVAIMTRYDQRVIDNVKRHEFALRSVVMDVMRQTVDTDLNKPEFRKELAVQIRDVMNTLLEKYEDFGGIEDVYFTSFIVQ
jgi:flagellar FliL protein